MHPSLHIPGRDHNRMSDDHKQLVRSALAWPPLLAVVLPIPHITVPSDSGAGKQSNGAVPLHVSGFGIAGKTSVCE